MHTVTSLWTASFDKYSVSFYEFSQFDKHRDYIMNKLSLTQWAHQEYADFDQHSEHIMSMLILT